MTLTSKLTIGISAAIVVTTMPFYYLKVRSIRQLLMEEAVAAADNVSETIVRTTHYDMLQDNRERVYRLIQEAGNHKEIRTIRLIDKEGRIIFSTMADEIGSYLDKSAAACDVCHSSEIPLADAPPMNRSRVFQGPDGIEVMGITKAIYNNPQCSSADCHVHPDGQRVLGVLDTVVSLDRVRAQTAAYTQRLILTSLVMLFALAGSLTLLVQRLVSRRVREILEHTRRVANLDFHHKIPAGAKDEIGDLARAFNDMTEKLRVAREQIESWTQELERRVKERTAEIRNMQSQLVRAEKLAALGELVAGIAHEINNPLTGILVMTSLLRDELRDNDHVDPGIREDLEQILGETHRCARIVKGLLDFSRESVPEKRPCSLPKLLDQTLRLFEGQAIFHNVRVRRAYAPDLPEVMVDANQLEQVFFNLILNAAQAMEGVGDLFVEAVRVNDFVEIAIHDTGVGIPEENLPKIFDPFFTTKESGGTGLGLSVSYGIVRNHGGTIDVESAVGHGTTFRVRLPRPPVEQQAA
ncbi:sensor histidine kinase [Deferrisoma palaeochoriense]